jgi:hypothetical protein
MRRMMITCWPSLYRPAEGRRVSLSLLFARVEAPRPYVRNEDVGRWSGALFRDNRRALANVRRVGLLAYDFDKGTAREHIAATFAGVMGFGHTTWSSTPELTRWRVALVLSRAVERDDYDRVWRAGAALAEAAGLEPDFAARDASRCWALPALRPGYEHITIAGVPFDVEAALARFPTPEPEPPPTHRWNTNDDLARRIERASKYLAAIPGAISGSGGHATTFRAALALVRGFALPEDEALRLLVEEFNPRCGPAWSLRELRHKVKQAAQRGLLEPGWLANRPLRRTV